MMPLTISYPGSYYLAENIQTSGGGITVQADYVTIDLMGFTLSGGTGLGIDGSGNERTTIRNGTVQFWSGTGIRLGGKAVLSDLIVFNNMGSGIDVGIDSRVTDCTVTNNTVHGIIVRVGSIVRNCAASNNLQNGIWVTSSLADHGALVTGCVVDMNERNGIRVDGFTTVLDNYIRGNDKSGSTGKAGIWINGDHNRIEGNTIAENNIGIDLDGSYNTIARNIFGASRTIHFDIDPGATYNLKSVFTIGSTGDPNPWDNIEYP
jgi:parallel beta-helix repeat protein